MYDDNIIIINNNIPDRAVYAIIATDEPTDIVLHIIGCKCKTQIHAATLHINIRILIMPVIIRYC